MIFSTVWSAEIRDRGVSRAPIPRVLRIPPADLQLLPVVAELEVLQAAVRPAGLFPVVREAPVSSNRSRSLVVTSSILFSASVPSLRLRPLLSEDFGT